MSICAIVAVDENWGIGNKGELLVSLPEDQKQNFKVKTLGHPGGRLLPGRENIILTRNPDLQVNGATVLHSVEEVVDYTKKDPDECYFIIGGEQIYKQFLPYCDTCIVSKIHKSFEADAFFPNLDNLKDWKVLSREANVHSVKSVTFAIWTYKRI